jgi:hypothetical protein
MIEDRWRTRQVLDLCLAIRQEQDYDSCPILADALEEAGCDDAGALLALRCGLGWGEACLLVAVIYDQSLQASVDYLTDMAEKLGAPARYRNPDDPEDPDRYDIETGEPLTAATLLEAARSYVKDGTHFHMGTNEAYKHCFWDDERTFWDHYERATGAGADDAFDEKDWKGGAFFSCSC